MQPCQLLFNYNLLVETAEIGFLFNGTKWCVCGDPIGNFRSPQIQRKRFQRLEYQGHQITVWMLPYRPVIIDEDQLSAWFEYAQRFCSCTFSCLFWKFMQ